MKDILKGSVIIFGFKLLGAASLFGVHLLIARHYGASTLGVFNLILAFLIFGAVFSKLGLDLYVIRVLPEIEADHLLTSGFIRKVFVILSAGAAVSMVLLMASLSSIDQYIFKNIDASSYLIVMAIIMFPFTYFNVIPEIFRGFQEIKVYSFYRNLSQNFFVFLALVISIFLLRLSIDPVWILYAVLCVITVVMSYHLHQFLKRRNVSILHAGEYSKGILVYSSPMLFTSVIMVLMGNIDSLMIGYYLDEVQVGIYSVCQKLSLALILTLTSISGFIAPKISKAYTLGRFDEIKRLYYSSIRLLVLVTVPILVVFFLFPGFFLGLFGDEFKVAVYTLLIVNTAFGINALFGPIGYILSMTDRQIVFMVAVFMALLINIFLNYLLIPKYHINGAAAATLVSMLSWNISSFIYLKRIGII